MAKFGRRMDRRKKVAVIEGRRPPDDDECVYVDGAHLLLPEEERLTPDEIEVGMRLSDQMRAEGIEPGEPVGPADRRVGGADAFRRLMACVEGGLRFSEAYSEEDAVADYLTLRPVYEESAVRATLAERLYGLHRVWGASVTSAMHEKRDEE
jgi:hypothetical protein